MASLIVGRTCANTLNCVMTRIILTNGSTIHSTGSRYGRFSTTASENKTENAETPPSPSPRGTQVDPVEFEKLKGEKEKLLVNVKELDDKYKRSRAENENIRQRMMKQIEDAKLFGIQKFCKDLLEVADVLQTACTSVPIEELNNQNKHLKSLYEGLQMTESQLQNVFRRHGLSQINPVGEVFNPNEHEAVFVHEDKSKEPNTVAIVSKLGYKLKDRVIRPALVGVVKSS